MNKQSIVFIKYKIIKILKLTHIKYINQYFYAKFIWFFKNIYILYQIEERTHSLQNNTIL